VTTQQPVLPVPKQELALVKRGLDAYFATLRKKGITVEAPFMDNDYCWWGHWNDDAVETAIGGVSGPMGVATCTMTLNTVSLAALPGLGPPAARRLALEWAVRGWQAVILRVWCAHAGEVRPRRHA
jgi:hypothetical protein